ncbi:MAG TPA: site-2 protease family protein [Opitutaceae bacterium]|nr:site-2 protease family protein [Opitutaceae bacterium]
MIFPWCYVFVPLESRFTSQFFLTLAAGVLEISGLVYAAVFLVIFVHEGGHWFFGRLVGIRINEFVVGAGVHGLQFTWRGIRFSFRPWLSSGYVRAIPARTNLQFRRQLIYMAGGVVAEVLFLLVLFFAPTWDHDSFGQAFTILRRYALISGVLGLWASVWPRMATLDGHRTPNDALLIQLAWQNRGKADAIWQQQESAAEANALCRAGKYVEAAAAVERMLLSDPRNAELMRSLASIHAAAKNWDRAMLVHHDIIQHSEPKSLQRVHAIDHAATFALQLGNRDELVRLRPLVEEALQIDAQPTVRGTLGSIMIELDDTVAGVEQLNRCLAGSIADHDIAIANAYLAKAALKLGRKQRAGELLGFAKARGADLPLVKRIVQELEPALQHSSDDSPPVSG